MSVSMEVGGNTTDVWPPTQALLFSGGTFLYVATVHVMPEVMSTNARASDAADTAGAVHGNELDRNQLIALCLGAVLPIVLSYGHSH